MRLTVCASVTWITKRSEYRGTDATPGRLREWYSARVSLSSGHLSLRMSSRVTTNTNNPRNLLLDLRSAGPYRENRVEQQ